MQLRWRTILRHRGEVIPEYNRDAGREIGDPARYPHDQPTDLLIFGCVEPEGRRVVIGAIPRGRRERKERTERAGVQHRREQKRNRKGGIALAALPEDSPPEEQRGGEKARVLQSVQSLVRKRGVEQNRYVPNPQRRGMNRPR